MNDLVFIVLGFYGDGSLRGEETVLCVFDTRMKADRFRELAEKTCPMKQIVVVPMNVEQ